MTGNSNTLTGNQANRIGLFESGDGAGFFVTGGDFNTLSGNTADKVKTGFWLSDSDSNTLENNHATNTVASGFYSGSQYLQHAAGQYNGGRRMAWILLE